jgi:sortase A
VYTNLYQSRVQSRLDRELASPELAERYRLRRLEVGDSLTRIKIPAIGVDTIVVEGTSDSALRAGAGHYPETPLPCEEGNVAIAGHRTTYGKPFANVDRLKPGDTITLETPLGNCVYEIAAVPQGRKAANENNAAFIISPKDVSVVGPPPGDAKMVTLTSCHPKHSAKQRIVIQAKLVKADYPSA